MRYVFYIVLTREDAGILELGCRVNNCTFDSWRPAVGPGRHCHVEGEPDDIRRVIDECGLAGDVEPRQLNSGRVA